MSNNEHNQNNQQKQIKSKSSVGSTLLIIFLIAVIMVTSSIGLYAWAKYTSSINGTATAQVAKWSFKLVDGVTETSDVIEFAFTRTDGYEHVAEGRLAPGTFGEFEIGIDARGTETILEYTIDVELENKPTNLKLYSDSARTEEIAVTNNTFSIKGDMDLEEVKSIKTVTVYWNWPYESGNDLADTNDAGKKVNMQISVTGTEVLQLETEVISFTIDGTTYNMDEGMTWGQWLESDYNTDGYRDVMNSYVANYTTNQYAVADSSGVEVDIQDAIIPNEKYGMVKAAIAEPD